RNIADVFCRLAVDRGLVGEVDGMGDYGDEPPHPVDRSHSRRGDSSRLYRSGTNDLSVWNDDSAVRLAAGEMEGRLLLAARDQLGLCRMAGIGADFSETAAADHCL